MRKPYHVLVLGNVRPEGLDLLREFAELTILPEPPRKADILKAIPAADAVLHKIAKTDAEIVAAQTRVQIIARHGVGLDDLDLDAIRAANIPVSITPAANSNAVAEATLGLTLAALRKVTQGERMIKESRAWARENLMGRELAHATVGIVGFGRIGQRTARLFHAFGARVVVYDAMPEMLDDCPYETAPLDGLLAQADVVCLHCPLMHDTWHLMNEERIGRMKTGSLLVNTSRGGLIDTAALTQALEAGKIDGAALDVFDAEPPDFDDPLFALPQVVTTPHVAAMTREAQIAMAVGAANEIRRVLVDNIGPSNDIFA
ncbi:hydroxyacid dehydrogenase [Martelella mediterranea]|uniref:hydroxyacid dehydrogenase n=1 Tax=Martelella mediterranea TaxID=293089 RepID=UPI001E3820EB|nr:hydroxyacid dehydrogenase [Martelella mediterranea]MCD1636464.1 hydroxyacid dehydrogenase [Martelella mediterranea]